MSGSPDRRAASANETVAEAPKRLTSLDAYRGFIMLAMVSGGFSFARLADDTRVTDAYAGTGFDGTWRWMWSTLAYQFSHVEWTGCGFWDLIQPSFMFMVGVSMPFSFGRRSAEGESAGRRAMHVLRRSIVLVLLGVFLSSNWSDQTNFTFVNVLTQIGLGYGALYLFLGRGTGIQLAGLAAILGGYWYYFYAYEIPQPRQEQVVAYLSERVMPEATPDVVRAEWHKFDGMAAHWNKHVNAAAAADRVFLNLFPRDEKPFPEDGGGEARQFWVNRGGYQTLNFIPSIATMLLGLMAGEMLRTARGDREKLVWMLRAGAICLVAGLAVDTSIWPVSPAGMDWSVSPIVKRIWTPSWAVFSAGWTFWMLAAFYWVIDMRGRRAWAFPFVVVGMNSIAMYVMAQLMKGWVRDTLHRHLATVDAALGFESGGIADFLYGTDSVYAPFWQSVSVLLVLWLICLWMYRQRIFVRI